MRLVVVESPYAGDIELNLEYLRACMADCLARGEAPYASHALYTQPGVLRDELPEERKLGMEAGFAWGAKADLTAVYDDLGMSRGMIAGIERAEAAGRPVERRSLPAWRPCEACPLRLGTETEFRVPADFWGRHVSTLCESCQRFLRTSVRR